MGLLPEEKAYKKERVAAKREAIRFKREERQQAHEITLLKQGKTLQDVQHKRLNVREQSFLKNTTKPASVPKSRNLLWKL